MLTVNDIAGFCPEEAVWKMLADVSLYAMKAGGGYTITADTVAVEGDQFMLTATADGTAEADMVWALGALAYYAATGHGVFGGHGSQYQQAHPQVALPVLQKGFSGLTPLIHRCLAYAPRQRISLEELRREAAKPRNMGAKPAATQQKAADGSPAKAAKTAAEPENWPEEMTL